ncbi:MAG: hypothetical protein ACM3OO_08850 [Planctomycetaceae bacterium]
MLAIVGLQVFAVASLGSATGTASIPVFTSASFWNTPLPPSAPVDPNSRAIIDWIRADSTTNYLRLAGASSTGKWGNPVYWAAPSDTAYAVANSCALAQPPAFASVRIPAGARPDPSSDAAMTVYDESAGIVYGFWHAAYDAARDAWSACGGTVYYLASNGLHHALAASDDPRNTGHRGVPPSAYAVLYGEIQAGSIDHVLKIAVDTTGCAHVFPMVGDECGTTAADAPPEGTRIRIDPSVDLGKLGLSPAALVIAEALQRYGAVIGDQSGGPTCLKLENTIAEGDGFLWNHVLTARSLRAIPLRMFEVVQLGYTP